jgi:hypothetical protein
MGSSIEIQEEADQVTPVEADKWMASEGRRQFTGMYWTRRYTVAIVKARTRRRP